MARATDETYVKKKVQKKSAVVNTLFFVLYELILESHCFINRIDEVAFGSARFI
jgi:hypothetical protein